MRLELVPNRDDWKGDQGISAIEVVGSTLKIEGWFDECAQWDAEVELSYEQRVAITDALEGEW